MLTRPNALNELEAEVFSFFRPSAPCIGLLSIPHSGEVIPEIFKNFLSSETRDLIEDYDMAVDRLIEPKELQKAGIAIMTAKVARVCIDLNRSEELAFLAWKQNSMGAPVVIKTPAVSLQKELMLRYYTPYYTCIKALLEDLHLSRQKVSFIDLHSMPSTPTAYHMKQNPAQGMSRADFCVSDNHGETCSKEFIQKVCLELEKVNPDVRMNDPYVGGHITKYVHQNFDFTNNLQIEIKRDTYMNEKTRILIPAKVDKMKKELTKALILSFQAFANE